MWIWEENKNWFHFSSTLLFSSTQFFCYRNGIFFSSLWHFFCCLSCAAQRNHRNGADRLFNCVVCIISIEALRDIAFHGPSANPRRLSCSALLRCVRPHHNLLKDESLGEKLSHPICCVLAALLTVWRHDGKISFYILSSESVLRFLYIFYTVRWRQDDIETIKTKITIKEEEEIQDNFFSAAAVAVDEENQFSFFLILDVVLLYFFFRALIFLILVEKTSEWEKHFAMEK